MTDRDRADDATLPAAGARNTDDGALDEDLEDVEETAPPRRTALVAAAVVGVVLLAFIAVLATGGNDDEDEASPLIGRPAPAVAGETLEGEMFDIDDLRGRWVLVNFFAEWCAPCLVEHPELVRFHETHAPSGEVEVVSVAFQDDVEDVAGFFARNGGEWPVLAEGVNPVAVAWGVTGIPESFLVSPQGVVAYKFTGGVTYEDLETVLAEARGVAPSGDAAAVGPGRAAR